MNDLAGGDYRGMITGSGAVQNLRIDNNIFVGTVDPANLVLSCVTFSGSSEDGATMNHSLFYQHFGTQRIVSLGSGPSYTMDEWFDYQTYTGWDADSPPPGDPLFVDAEDNDFRLQPGSPAINAGAVEPDRTADHDGNPMVDAPDLGAFERQAP